MRDKLLFLWRKITRIKALHPLVVFIRYFAATNFFNTIDAVVGEERNVTYIKMDVEGAELKSLMGAEGVIRRSHPRLAVSIYHSDADMIDIIEYIKKQFPFYQLYVRHYTYFYADTVLYAIDRQ